MAEGGFQREKQNAVQRTNHAVAPRPPQPLPATQESLNRQPVTQVPIPPTHMCVCESLSHVQLFGTPQTAACQAHMSMGFSSQEY